MNVTRRELFTNPFFTDFDTFVTKRPEINKSNYPPYNIIKTGEDTFIIEIAVAGFLKSELKVIRKKNKEILLVEGSSSGSIADDAEYLHKGLASRSFKKSFTVASNIVVDKTYLENGVLTIKLRAEKPKEELEDIITIE